MRDHGAPVLNDMGDLLNRLRTGDRRPAIAGRDALTLEVHANLLARLDAAPAASADAEDDAEDGVAAAAPLALAIDVDDPAEPLEAAATPT